MAKKYYDFKIGECWNFELSDNPGFYYTFLIVSELKQGKKIFWIAIKNETKKPGDLWPIIIDKYGIDRNKIGAYFYCIGKSRARSLWKCS